MAQRKTSNEDLPPGIVEMTPTAAAGAATAEPPTGFWRIRAFLPAFPEPGAPDHVVRAEDRANAELSFCRELGITTIDKSVNQFTVEPASEADYIVAQAKRLHVDLREHCKKDVDKKHPEYGKLTWQPPGGRQGEYKVSDKGELSAAE